MPSHSGTQYCGDLGRRVADAWNDAVAILSALAALTAVALATYDPARFLAADHYGGFVVGIVVVITGIRVVRDASLELVDTMPSPELTGEILPEGGFPLSVAACRGSWGLCAASPGTAEITTAAQPAIIAVTILFTLMIDSFRAHDVTTKPHTESSDNAVHN